MWSMERSVETLRVAYIYLTSGMMGVLLSSIVTPSMVGACASAPLFGILGSRLGELVHHFHREHNKKRLLRDQVLAVGAGLALGLLPFVSAPFHSIYELLATAVMY